MNRIFSSPAAAVLVASAMATTPAAAQDGATGGLASWLRARSTDQNLRLCTGGIFKPCVCWQDVPRSVRYRPSDRRCGRSTYPGDEDNYNASISLTRDFVRSFSVVVRTFDNADRSPYEPALCSKEEFDAGLNKCSRWKSQETIRRPGRRTECLGASGYSDVFAKIRRMTIKVSNEVDANGEKDIRRLCLRSPRRPLN